MSTVVEALRRKKDILYEKGATEEDIRTAELNLGLLFSADYKEYLQHYGSVSCGGHELTGITTDNNLDVVLVTKRNLKKNPSVTMPLYVIEETHMDGIVVWQASTGEVFQTGYMDSPLKIYDSLVEYVSSFPEEL